MRSTSTWLAAALLSAIPALAQSTSTTASSKEQPSKPPQVNVAVVQGCFSSPGELVSIGKLDFNTRDKCAVTYCKTQGYDVAASMGGAECFCGMKYPPKSTLTNDTECDTTCPGWGPETCGGPNKWTVYNTGRNVAVENSDESILSSTASGSSTTTKPTAAAASTVVESVTLSVTPTGTEKLGQVKSGGGSSNTAGIAAGVVVGVAAIAGIMGGIFFYMRRRRSKELEEKHSRNAAISTFFPGKPPGSSGGFSVSDSRLDPVMAQRRISNGSIADNEDYSRKILRVTNA